MDMLMEHEPHPQPEDIDRSQFLELAEKKRDHYLKSCEKRGKEERKEIDRT
jgi:vacuolar-type H+-ATPase subunit H